MTCQAAMTKVTESKSPPSAGAAKANAVQTAAKKKNKKKKFWKHTVKEEPAKVHGEAKATPFLPPKVPQEFSSNWKALQELLKPKTTNLSNPPLPSPAVSGKKHKTLEAKAEAVSGKKHKTLEAKAEGSSTAKENGSKVQPSSKSKTEEKSNGASSVKAVSAKEKSTSDKKDHAGKKKRKKNGFFESEEDHNQHKKSKPEEIIKHPLTEDDLWFDDVDPDDIEAALGPEAGGIARKKLGLSETKPLDEVEKMLVKEKAFDGLTKAVAMDCEMVGVGPDGEESIVARVSIVNLFGKCIYDKYVKPTEKVTDYRTAVSGIRPKDIRNGEEFKVVQKDVASILEGRILVGHALHNDLKILFLDHPRKKIRDTQRYKPFKQEVKSGRPSLKLLCDKLLNVKVQTSEHSSVQDAQAAMRLYTLHKKLWEASIKDKYTAQKQTAKERPVTESS